MRKKTVLPVKPQKKSGKGAWVLIIIFLLLFWPIGLVMLFMKLTDIRREKEDSIPLEEFLSYSDNKSQADNEASVAKEKSSQRAFKASKYMTPLMILVGGTSAMLDVHKFIVYGYSGNIMTDLMRSLACLGVGVLFGGYCYFCVKRQKRIYRYMDVIRSQKAVPLRLIAEQTGYETEQITEDLQDMIHRLYFELTAHLNLEEGMFYRGA